MQSIAGVHGLSVEAGSAVSLRNAVQIRKSASKLQRPTKALSAVATQTIGSREQVNEKRVKTQEKLKRLMRGSQTPLSELVIPAAPSPFAPYSEMSEEEIAEEVERKRDELAKQAEHHVPNVFHFGYQQSMNMAPGKAKAGKKEAHKKIKAILASGTKTKVVVVKPDRPYRSAPTNLTPEMIEGIMKQLEKKRNPTYRSTGSNLPSGLSALDEAREASQQKLRQLMSGKQTPLSKAHKANNKGAMPQYSDLSEPEIKAIVERTRQKVDQIIAEEKAEQAAERAMRRAQAVFKAVTTGDKRPPLPEGMTVVAEGGRAQTLTPSSGDQAASASLSVEEKRAAAQQQLKSLMSRKQTPLSEVATAGGNGAMSQYSKYSDAEIALLVNKQKLKNASTVIVEKRDEAAAETPFRESSNGSEKQAAEIAEAQGSVRPLMTGESAAAKAEEC